eukprot:CAMPEP_0204125980 /NCGR_PEP_ID=MMETSP0361-20130328/10742_1 /ASSEMBLY_ACC=CAM_ASM_000343 /TAXON_ID=268821 /ORGANISM="Scrippsiella Hangoei, Strain SHTV-5" /LENGTH=153 /DNA_ID=CAMNT_0051077785 /DNA_START=75 /DNA_END=536 /DNA_ORIENTATION=+
MGKKEPKEVVEEKAAEEEEEEPKVSLYVSPLATPLVTDKLLARSLKLIKKSVSEKKTRRGVPECTKAIRKGQQGICFLAGDIFPMDVFAHIPTLCEEKGIYYVYVKSRHELGAACQTRRPISLIMVMEPPDDSAYSSTYQQVVAGIKAVHPYM